MIVPVTAVNASMMPVVNRPRVEKRLVLVALVVVARSIETPPLNVEDADTRTPSVVVGARAPLAISQDLPKLADEMDAVISAKVGRPSELVAVSV